MLTRVGDLSLDTVKRVMEEIRVHKVTHVVTDSAELKEALNCIRGVDVIFNEDVFSAALMGMGANTIYVVTKACNKTSPLLPLCVVV